MCTGVIDASEPEKTPLVSFKHFFLIEETVIPNPCMSTILSKAFWGRA
jgi:hypothetical protein